MDIFTLISTRRSIRRYHATPISEEKLARILEAGRLAPSAHNRQPWHFLVITDPVIRQHLQEAYHRDWFSEPPVLLAVCMDPREEWVRHDGQAFGHIDASIALQNMILQATAEGLGSCWIGAFDEAKAKQILRIPDPIRIVAMTPLGYPAEAKEPITNRKSLQELLHYDTW
jgi:nitroreductase